GNGQSELIEGITGLREIEEGKVILNGKEITNLNPKEIIESGLSNIPEDRQDRGLVLDFSVAENMILENYYKKPFSEKGKLNHKEINNYAKKLIDSFDVRPKEESMLAKSLSGGNQQKVIVAREISNDPDVLVAAQPTRGLDVGAIEFVHKYLVEQRDKGKAVLLVSFELDEILNLSDRIAVIYNGKIVKILDRKDADENKLGYLMAGGGADSEAK
ncbi:MAG TPA: ATP-binding cassette domain-containing protein, partial [Tissierellales bacterium]|nr:ATP-binding cassette domain-containing protein [Tissierellales bacterium]